MAKRYTCLERLPCKCNGDGETEKDSKQLGGSMLDKLRDPITPVYAAMMVLKKAMKEDEGYAHSWHCNIAMAFYDEMQKDVTHQEAHRVANRAASRFMKMCFDVETSSNQDVQQK